MRRAILSVVGIVAIAAVGWYLYNGREVVTDNGQVSVSTTTSEKGVNVPNTGTPTLPIVGTQAPAGDIVVDKPKLGDKISSPLVVSGRAKGSWYFEASAPVTVIDTNGVVIGRGHITAQGDWMTATGTVPFTGTIEFSGNTSSEGAVVFMNDNPSGLKQNAKYYAVPVFFK